MCPPPHERLDRAELDTQFPARYAGQNYQSTSHQAYGAGFGRAHASASVALGGDDISIHGHRAISGQSTAAGDVSAGIQGDAAQREYVSCELRPGAEVAELPTTKNTFLSCP